MVPSSQVPFTDTLFLPAYRQILVLLSRSSGTDVSGLDHD